MKKHWLLITGLLIGLTVMLSFGIGVFLVNLSSAAGGFEKSDINGPREASQGFLEPSAGEAHHGSQIQPYRVYSNGAFVAAFESFEEAVENAKNYEQAFINNKETNLTLWNNFPPFTVYMQDNIEIEYHSFADAVRQAKTQEGSRVYFKGSGSFIWENGSIVNKSYQISGVPLIKQLPELDRGCEVTSLAMLINYMGTEVDKMTLAEEIKKDPSTRSKKNGKIYYGDPNNGFIGDIYDLAKDGFGVYHKPIFELLERYFPKTAVDLTGSEFDDIYKFIGKGRPVWVIINSRYTALPPSEFETWHTPSGEIQITYREHSVLITGYDERYIYFNDPYDAVSRYNKKDFIDAWEQMGRQAITIIN